MKKLLRENLTAHAAEMEPVLESGLRAIQAKHPEVVGRTTCKGLVAGLQFVKRGTREPDHDLAHRVIENAFYRGLLLFSPVGAWGQTVKIAPPLTIPKAAILEGLAVLEESVDEAIRSLLN